MSNKPLIGYFNKIAEFNNSFIINTNSIKIYDNIEKDGHVTTTVILLTDNLEMHFIKYDKNAKDFLNKRDIFEIKNHDYITIIQRVFKDKKKLVEYVTTTFERTKGKYPDIHDKDGFKKLIKTRKAILSNIGTYTPEGFMTYTNFQKDPNIAKKFEQADLAISCIDIVNDNSIHNDIRNNLNQMFDSVSCIYRRSWSSRSGKFYNAFKNALFEYIDIDISNKVVIGVYNIIEHLINTYPFSYDDLY